MNESHTFLPDLESMVEVHPESIVSRTVFKDAALKAVLFGFAQGQELSEHTASVPAVIHMLSGKARLILGRETVEADAGSWVHMPAGMPHSLLALTPVRMLLLLLQRQSDTIASAGRRTAVGA